MRCQWIEIHDGRKRSCDNRRDFVGFAAITPKTYLLGNEGVDAAGPKVVVRISRGVV